MVFSSVLIPSGRRQRDMEARQDKPAHVLIFPFPLQGHVTTMLRLAELLSLAAGLHVTFLNTDHNHDRFRRFSGAHARLSQRPGFRFRSVPDGLPDGHPRSALHLMELAESLRTRSAEPFRQLLAELGSSREEPPVTCSIVDGVMPFAMDISESLGVPAIVFRTISACSFWSYFRIPNLIEKGELPFPTTDDPNFLDGPVRGVAGMETFLRRRDLPSFVRDAKDLTDEILQFVSAATHSSKRARGLILNTFESLDGPLLARIRDHFPVTYAVGPLNAFLRTLTSHRLQTDLREVDRSCMAWLDRQPDESVVYVGFGSLAKVTREQLLEIWHGLANSGQRFLWVVRPDLVQGPADEGNQLQLPALERGRLVEWAPQEEVLAHPAVSCFLTHGGWNSTIESIAAGVPMVCWPYFADQQVNSRFVGEVWKVGVDMKDTCERGVVERMVREVVGSEQVKRAARELAEEVRRSVADGGSSYAQFQRLAMDIKSFGKPI